MIKVIVIEDKNEYRQELESAVNKAEDMNCISAYGNAEDCLEHGFYLDADVALVDIQLPGRSGIEFVAEARGNYPALLCIMCTAYEEDEKIFNALACGAHGYLLKSGTQDEIIAAIRETWKGGSPMSTAVARKVVDRFKTNRNENFKLTDREIQVLNLLAKGYLYKEIAASYNLSIETVRRHCYNIYEKLHVDNRTEALNKYFKR